MSTIYPNKPSHLMRVLANQIEGDEENPNYILLFDNGEDILSSANITTDVLPLVGILERIKLELLLSTEE